MRFPPTLGARATASTTSASRGEDFAIACDERLRIALLGDSFCRGTPSRLLDFVRVRIDRLREARALIEQIDSAYQPGHPGLRSVEAALARLRQSGNEDGVIRLLAVIPWLYRVGNHDPFREAHAAVAKRAEREGFEVLDLLPAFAGRRDADLRVHPVDHHPNVVAHSPMADAMTRRLVFARIPPCQWHPLWLAARLRGLGAASLETLVLASDPRMVRAAYDA